MGHEVIDEVIDRGLLEVLPLTHIRGRSLTDSFVVIDEAQNLERTVLLTALSRLGRGSRVVLTHDVAQRDNLRVGRHDGVVSVIEALKGHPLFAHVTLTRSERSAIAALVTELLDGPPADARRERPPGVLGALGAGPRRTRLPCGRFSVKAVEHADILSTVRSGAARANPSRFPPLPDSSAQPPGGIDCSVEAFDHDRDAADRAPLVPEDWVADAACKGQTHLFFPPRAERPQARVRREAQARLLCATLPRRAAVPGLRPGEPRVRVLGRRVRGGAPPGRVHGGRADRRQGARSVSCA